MAKHHLKRRSSKYMGGGPALDSKRMWPMIEIRYKVGQKETYASHSAKVICTKKKHREFKPVCYFLARLVCSMCRWKLVCCRVFTWSCFTRSLLECVSNIAYSLVQRSVKVGLGLFNAGERFEYRSTAFIHPLSQFFFCLDLSGSQFLATELRR